MAAFSAPTSKLDEHVSVKLRALNMKNIKNAKATTRQLEMENQRMEERLQELRLAMNREKEEREQRGTGSGFWESGKEGRLNTYNKDADRTGNNKSASNRQKREKNSASRRNRVKVLKDEPIAVPERNAQPGTIGNIAKRSALGARNVKGPRCGQCEHKAANVSCQECGEDYCAACFTSFHLKGALRKHRSVPVGSAGSRTPRPTIPTENPPNACDIKIVARPLSSRTNDLTNENSGPPPAPVQRPLVQERSKVQASPKPIHIISNCEQVSSLLDGEYDEDAEAAAFQLALQEWRKGKTGASQNTYNVMDASDNIESGKSAGTDSGTCTAPERHAPVEIHFTQSLTYAEKLLLKRHRKGEIENGIVENGLYDISDPDAEVDLGTMLAMSRGVTPAPQNEDYFRAESRVSIIDLDEFQEPRHSLRGLDQSTSYFVQEMPVGLDYYQRGVPPESRAAFSSPTPKPPAGKPRTPNSAKRRGVRSPISPSTAAMDTDNTPIMDLKALNDYKKQSRRELMQMNKENRSSFDSAYSPELPPSKSRAELEKYYDRKKKKVAKSEVKLPEEVPGARPKSKTGFQPRIKSRTGSRPTSRANSRAASRTGSRLSVSGEGLLTKGPSDGLRALAGRYDGLPATAPEAMLGLGDFFTAGVKGMPSEDTSAPASRPQSRAKSARPNTGRQSRQEEKWKVSYKTYQMAPRSWKPDNSVGESISDQQLDLQLEQGARDFMQVFGMQEMPPEELLSAREASLSFSLSGSVDTGVDKGPQEKQPTERSSARNKSATSKTSKEKSSKSKAAGDVSERSSSQQSTRVSSRNEDKTEKKKSSKETPRGAEKTKSSRETPRLDSARSKSSRETPLLDSARAKSSRETPRLDSARDKSSRETPRSDSARAKSSRKTPRTDSARAKSSRETPRSDSARAKSSRETPRSDSARGKAKKSSRETPTPRIEPAAVEETPRGASAMSDATLVPEITPRSFSRQRSRPGTPRASSLSESLGNGRKTPGVSSARMKTPALPEEPAEGAEAEGAEAERPESRAIVVDGDDMSKYDDELLAIQQDEDDDAALNQLEWELASQEGRVTADGQISRMSQLPGLTEEEMELGIGSDDGRSSGLSTPEPTLDWDTDRPNQLRESALMGDFEAMEYEMAAAQEKDDDEEDDDNCDDMAEVRGLH